MSLPDTGELAKKAQRELSNTLNRILLIFGTEVQVWTKNWGINRKYVAERVGQTNFLQAHSHNRTLKGTIKFTNSKECVGKN